MRTDLFGDRGYATGYGAWEQVGTNIIEGVGEVKAAKAVLEGDSDSTAAIAKYVNENASSDALAAGFAYLGRLPPATDLWGQLSAFAKILPNTEQLNDLDYHKTVGGFIP